MWDLLPLSFDDLSSFACAGFAPLLFTVWFIISLVQFLCSGKKEKQLQKRRLTLLIVSGILMTLCYVGLIFLYYAFAQIMQSM